MHPRPQAALTNVGGQVDNGVVALHGLVIQQNEGNVVVAIELVRAVAGCTVFGGTRAQLFSAHARQSGGGVRYSMQLLTATARRKFRNDANAAPPDLHAGACTLLTHG